jgi:hypothetical protein
MLKIVLFSTEASSPFTKQPMKSICKEPLGYCWNYYNLDIFDSDLCPLTLIFRQREGHHAQVTV